MPKYRIVEEINGLGVSYFYPERRGWFGWSRFTNDLMLSACFRNKKEAEDFIALRSPNKIVIHEVEETQDVK